MQGLVGSVHGIAQLQRDAMQQPFPVPEMRGHQHDTLAGVEITTRQFSVGEDHAAAHIGFGHRHRFEKLDQYVAETPQELLVDVFALIRAQSGEHFFELLANHMFAMANDVVSQKIQKRRKCV